ncbi:hypothetical protein K505DRAFT_337152 [Melanomma pulvis-pyrius CBS 109.77]|uniref:Rhodopsin domain-containing protein n=1 Tax=Melanomma pulvis-pyrius CBS 109.77 TaxID=1314802 RepID=A0A6A6XDL4_9PLEO|nr:hypothetical protein K505DRAFT_337152 [Melanomma pulvis-pyrius CBS 109.77]
MESLESFHHRLDGAAISTYVLIMILVPLKLWCRKRAGGWRNLGLDDAISVVSLLSANGFFWICIIGMRKSLGHQVTEVETADLIQFLYYVFWGQILYLTSIAITKFSILAFYWRLFSVTARIPIMVVTFVVFAWLMSLLFIVIFACNPVRGSWDITITTAKCIPVKSIYLGGSVPNVITDAILVMMPIPYVWRLHAPLAQRIILASMFMLGIFIAIVSIIRLRIFLSIPIATSANVTYNFREVIVWSIVEINIGLTCACLPSLKPAIGFLGLNKLFSLSANSRPSNATPGPGGTDDRPSNFVQSGRSRGGRKKGSTGGLFSTLAGLTKLDSEEDGFKIIDDDGQKRGLGHGDVELARVSHDSDRGGSRGTMHTAKAGGITVQRDWSVRTG